jgi:hypothetical protein
VRSRSSALASVRPSLRDIVPEFGHRVGVVARAGEQTDADAIGFRLLAAREIDRALHGDALAHRHGALDRLAIGAGGGADEDGREQRRGGGQRGLALRLHRPGDMPRRRAPPRAPSLTLRFVALPHQPLLTPMKPPAAEALMPAPVPENSKLSLRLNAAGCQVLQ